MSRRMLRMVLGPLATAIVLAGAFSSGAFAGSTHPDGTTRAAKGQPRETTTRTPYTASYTDEKFGPVTCTGVHISSSRYPGTATTGGADKFRCKSTTGKPVTYGNPGETLPENFTPWASDYFNNQGHFVLAKKLNVKLSAHGKSYTGIAVYTSPEEEAQKAKEKEEQEKKEKEATELKEKEAQEQKEREEAETGSA